MKRMSKTEKVKTFLEGLKEKKSGDKCCLFCKHWSCEMLRVWRAKVGSIADTTYSCTEYKEVE